MLVRAVGSSTSYPAVRHRIGSPILGTIHPSRVILGLAGAPTAQTTDIHFRIHYGLPHLRTLRREYSVGRFFKETGRSTVAQQRHNRTVRRRRIKSGVASECRAARKVVQPSRLDVHYTLSLCVAAPVAGSPVMAWWYVPFPLFSLV